MQKIKIKISESPQKNKWRSVWLPKKPIKKKKKTNL